MNALVVEGLESYRLTNVGQAPVDARSEPISGNLSQGLFVAQEATPVQVLVPSITADNFVAITPGSNGGVQGPWKVTIQAGVGFTFTSSTGDTNDYNYRVL